MWIVEFRKYIVIMILVLLFYDEYGIHVVLNDLQTRWSTVRKRYGEEEFLEFQEASNVTMKICSLPSLLCVESICIGTCLFLTTNVVLILMR